MRQKRAPVALDELKDYLDYDRANGFFRWKQSTNNMNVVGAIAGRDHNGKYRQISLFGKRYLVHRLVYYFETGHWPKYIDHIDRDPSNNHFSNLREVTMRDNSLNKKNNRRMPGVQLHPWGRWSAKIRLKNQNPKHLGMFDTEADAHAAYLRAKEQLDSIKENK